MKYVSLRMAVELADAIKGMADAEGDTPSAWIRKACEERLGIRSTTARLEALEEKVARLERLAGPEF